MEDDTMAKDDRDILELFQDELAFIEQRLWTLGQMR